jgi:phage-related protein
VVKRTRDSIKPIITTIMAVAFGVFIGASLPALHLTKVIFATSKSSMQRSFFNVFSSHFSFLEICRLTYLQA